MSRNRGISVGAKITGDAKGFKAASEEAQKATEALKNRGKKASAELDKAFKQVGIAMAAIASAVVVAKKGFEVYSDAMNSTTASADKLSTQLAVMDSVMDTIYRSIQRGDFSTLTRDIKRAIQATKELAASEETATQRLSDLEVRKSEIRAQIYGLTNKQTAGTITPSEVQELKRLHTEIFLTEQDIYKLRIEDAIKFGASKEGVDRELFANMQEGIIARSYLSAQEVDEMSNMADRYREAFDKLKTQATSRTFVKASDGTLHQQSIFNAERHIELVNEWIATLTNIERVQLFEDVYSTPQEFEALISYMVTLNNLEQEHERYLKRIKPGKGGSETTLPRLPSMEKMSNRTGLVEGGGADYSLAPMMMAEFNNEIIYSTQILNELESSFRDLFASTGGGFNEMADAFISAIQRMAAEAMAKMAIFMLLNALTGGTGGIANWASQMLGGQNLSQFMGFTKSASIPTKSLGQQALNINVTGKIGARDIFLAGQRYNDVLNDNT